MNPISSFHLLGVAIVIVARDHNPSILNPDFLAIRGIVPVEWGWAPTEVLTTQPVAQVKYDSNVSLLVEQNKLTISDNGYGSDPVHSNIDKVAAKYMEVLEHVRYTAVGINFRGVILVEKPHQYLRNLLFIDTFFSAAPHGLMAAGAKVMSHVEGGRVTYSLDCVEKRPEGADDRSDSSGILVAANFHRDCQGDYPTKNEAVALSGHMRSDWHSYMSFLETVAPKPEV